MTGAGANGDAAAVTGPPAVEVTGIRFAHPDGRVALDDIHLRIETGERVAVLGPNGAGKTTLMLHLNGILRPAVGDVRIGGRRVTPAIVAACARSAGAGLVFQDPDDQLFMPTVRADVALGPANHGLTGIELTARVQDAFAAVGMEHAVDRHLSHLSMGERRRVALATVLATDPDVLVLDEPSSNLDPRARRELVEVLRDLVAGARSHSSSSRTTSRSLELCPRSVVLDDGRLVADGDTRTLLADDVLLGAHRLELPYGFDRSSLRVTAPPA
ncbi:MAG: ABC transporter ATP-binding protein [Ilumatobacteraceae bacterium]